MFETRHLRRELRPLQGGADAIRRSALPSFAETFGAAHSPASAVRTLEAILLAVIIVLVNGYGALSPDTLDGFAQADLIHSGSALGQIVWGSVYVVAAVGIFRRWRPAGSLLKRSLPLIGLVAVIVASTLWSSDPGLTAKRALGLVGTTAVAYWIATRFSLRDFLRITSIAIAVCVLLSLIAVVVAPSIGVMQTEYPGTWRGIFGHKNYAGEALAIGILTMVVFFKQAGRLRPFIGVTLLLSVLFLIQTQAATSALAVAVGIAVFAIVELWRNQRTRPAAILVAGMLALVTVVVAFNWQSAFEDIGRDTTLTGRTDIWPAALSAIADRLWLGFGYSVFWVADGPVLKYIAAGQGWQPYHAHNGFLQLTLDAGLLASGTFVVLFLSGVFAAARLSVAGRERLGAWPLMVMVGFVVLNASDSLIAIFNSFSWIVFCAAYLYAVGSGTRRAVRPNSQAGTELAPFAARGLDVVVWQETH